MSKNSNPVKGSKRKSISTKISVSLLVVLVPLLVVLILCSCIMASSAIEKLNDKLLEEQTKYAVSAVNNFFKAKTNSISMLNRSVVFEDYFRNVSVPEEISSYSNLEGVLDQLSNAQKNVAEENVEQVWVADQDTDRYLFSTGEVVEANLNNVSWDEEVMSSKATVVSEPYLDPASGKQVISIVSPVFSGSDVAGFVGFDVFVDTLSAILSEIKVGQKGFMELLSKNSDYIYTTDPASEGKNVSELDITDTYKNSVINKREGVLDFSFAGADYTARSRICDINNWMVMATLPMSEVNATRNQLIFVLAAIAVATLLIMVVFILFLIRNTIKPLTEIGKNVQEFAEGNLGVEVKIRSNDEIGLLADNVRSTIETLKDMIHDISGILSQISNGNLDVSVEGNYVGDFMPIQEALVRIIQSLNNTLGQINESGEQVAGGSDQLATGAQALSQGATEQAASLEELAATINEISKQVKDTAKNATEASQQSNDAATEVTACNNQMQDMISAIGEISEKSNEIGKIIKTIEDIAFQTNILALNAAVEAARSGVAGKGFAVVADEVRSLAGKSAEASKNTSVLIESSIQAVEKGSRIASETAQSLLKVVESTQTVSGTVDQITDAANVQAESIEQVTQTIDQITSVVQTNSATAEESAASSEELSAQAQLLKSLVSQFKLSNSSEKELRIPKLSEIKSETFDLAFSETKY